MQRYKENLELWHYLRPPIRSTLDIHKTVIISTSSGFRHDGGRLLCHTRHQLRKVDHAETGGRPGRLKGLWSLARDSYKETYPTWPTSLRAQTWKRSRESVTDRRQQSPISWLIIEISCLQFRAASVPSKAASLSRLLCLRSASVTVYLLVQAKYSFETWRRNIGKNRLIVVRNIVYQKHNWNY